LTGRKENILMRI